jgi:hypothetical protein
MMTFLQPPISFRRKLAEDEPAITSHVEPVANVDPSAADHSATTSIGTIPPRLYILSSLSGALAAVIVVSLVAMFLLRTHDDTRLVQMTHDAEDLSAHVQSLTDKIRTLETESVVTGQTTDTLGEQVKSSASEVNAIKAALTALVAEQQRASGAVGLVNAPALLGVAVVQLRDRIETGLPFEWELVDVRGIVGEQPLLVAETGRLLPMAKSGVVTQERLQSAMRGFSARDGSGVSYVQAGLSAVGRALGSNLVSPATNDTQVLARAQARLTAGDLLNFVREIQGLSHPTAEAARPLVEAVKQRLVAQQAVQSLLQAARTGLQGQLRAAADAATQPGH